MKQITRLINCIGDKNRERKYQLFCSYFKTNENSKILDVGASEREYRATSNLLEKRYLYPENITVLGVDNYNEFNNRYPAVKTVKYAGGLFPFKDNTFEICWCNAVIEHVGSRSSQELFIKEIKRVSKRAFITTPNKYFFYEPHTKVVLLHYLPRDLFNSLLKITRNSYPGNLIHLLGIKDMEKLLLANSISDYKIIKNKLFGFTLDFVVLF